MNNLRWVLVGALAICAGIALVRYLTVAPMLMSLWALICVFLLGGLVFLIARSFHTVQVLVAVALALAGLAIGWLGANAMFLHQEEQRSLPAVNPPAPDLRDHTAVVYLTHGEPPGYDPMPWVETMKEMDSLKVPFMPTALRPLFFNAYRNEYLKLGGSPHNIMHGAMINSLERLYRQDGDETTRFYLSFLDSNPRPDEMVIRAINAGAKRIVLMPVFVTISSHTEAGQDMVKELNVAQYGVPVCYAEPLWDSELLQQMFVERARKFADDSPRAKVGILLVGHGQPAEWDAVWPTQTTQEIEFREGIVEKLVADGFLRENISLAWMGFKNPPADEEAVRLAKNDLEKLLVFSATISASSLHSIYDIPNTVAQANLPENLEVINLGAWDDDPLVIAAIREKIDACEQ